MLHLQGYGILVFSLMLAVMVCSVLTSPVYDTKEKTNRHLSNKRLRRSRENRVLWLDFLSPPVATDKPTDIVDNSDNKTIAGNDTALDIEQMTHDSSHCQNGGIGFLGSFCVCPPNYAGQYCEKKIGENCDVIQHGGDSIYIDCSVCRCADGYLECMPHHLPGCDEKEAERQRRLEEERLHNSQVITSPQLIVLYTASLVSILGIAYASGTLSNCYASDIYR